MFFWVNLKLELKQEYRAKIQNTAKCDKQQYRQSVMMLEATMSLWCLRQRWDKHQCCSDWTSSWESDKPRLRVIGPPLGCSAWEWSHHCCTSLRPSLLRNCALMTDFVFNDHEQSWKWESKHSDSDESEENLPVRTRNTHMLRITLRLTHDRKHRQPIAKCDVF